MNDPSDEAQSLFQAGRAGHEPSDEDRERVLRGVLVRTGIVTSALAASTAAASQAAGAAGTAVGASSSSGMFALGLKLLVGLAVLGSAGAGLYHLAAPHSALKTANLPVRSVPLGSRIQPLQSSPRMVPLNAVPLSNSPEFAALPPGPAPANSKADVRPSLPLEAKAQPTYAPPIAGAPVASALAVAAFPDPTPAASSKVELGPPQASAAGSQLSDEARALADVQRALRDGRNSDALSMVDQQQRKFATGELAQERQAAKIVALCAAGRVSEARALGARFLADSPRSPVAARIRATCAAP